VDQFVNEFLKYFFSNPFVILFFIVVIIVAIFNKQIIGWFGEHWTKQALKKLPKNEYKILNDVFIETNGITHQIDHVVVSSYGIFSIETKQYNGFITGNKYDKNWIRHAGKNKYYYTNPIRQNYGHVKAVCQFLNISEDYVHNIVSIPSDCKINISDDGETCIYSTLLRRILAYKYKVLNNYKELAEKLENGNITNSDIRREHVHYVRNIKKDYEHNLCPRCGGKLVKRNGKYGSFVGCSNYPKCRYTRKDDDI